jgi:hypothetical protein
VSADVLEHLQSVLDLWIGSERGGGDKEQRHGGCKCTPSMDVETDGTISDCRHESGSDVSQNAGRRELSWDHFLRVLFFLLAFLSFTLVAIMVLLSIALRTETVFGRPVAMGLAGIRCATPEAFSPSDGIS